MGSSEAAERPEGALVTPPFAWRAVVGVAGVLLAVLLALAGRYGPHRDELYFLAAGRHLDWGFADQPPLTPLLAHLADVVAPGSLWALHAPAALMMAAVVVLAALIARELGGARDAQVLTALTVGTGVVVVGLGHWLSTATTDTLLRVATTLLVTRTLVRDRPRGWLAVGAVAGVGLLDKHLIAFLLGGLALGVAATPAVRHHLRSWWTWAGVGIALVLWAPNLVWQALHGWPQLTLAGQIRDEYLVPEERIGYLVLLVALVSPVAAALWAYGWRRLARAPELVRAKPLAWAFAILALVFFATGGKAYYLAGFLPALVAAGAVELRRAWPERRVRRARWVLVAAAVVAWPVVLPVLPMSAYAASPLSGIDETQAEMIGWPAFARTVNGVVDDAGARVVVTANYGEAGALEWYGTSARVFSGHNAYGDWGPPPDDDAGPVVLVGFWQAPGWARGCREAARIDNGLDVDNEEQGGPVLVCAGPAGTWSQVWDEVRHLNA